MSVDIVEYSLLLVQVVLVKRECLGLLWNLKLFVEGHNSFCIYLPFFFPTLILLSEVGKKCFLSYSYKDSAIILRLAAGQVIMMMMTYPSRFGKMCMSRRNIWGISATSSGIKRDWYAVAYIGYQTSKAIQTKTIRFKLSCGGNTSFTTYLII
jgi:hypothetical protein